MEAPILVSTITTTTDTQHARIHGRPVRIYPGSDPRSGRVWKMVFLFLDHTGGQIQGIVATPDYNRISNVFAEHNIVEITRFTVESSTKDYQVVDYNYSLKLTDQTQVRLLAPDAYPIPRTHFDFKEIERVGDDIVYEKAVLDVLARIVVFSDVRTVPSSGQETRLQNMYLMNERGYTISVTLWADFVDSFNIPDLYEQSKTSPVVVACNSLQVNYWSRVYSLKTYTRTRFYLDPTMKEIADYLEKIPHDGKPITLHATPEMFQAVVPVQLLLPAPKPVKITLAQLRTLYLDNFTEMLYECPARITHVINPFHWSYPACTDCHKKVEHTIQGLYCPECKMRRRQSIPWYRVRVQVRDQTDEAQFVLLGKTGEMIIGTDVISLKAEQDRLGGKALPILQAIVNRAYLFTVSGKQIAGYRQERHYNVTRHELVPEDKIAMLPDPILLLERPPIDTPSPPSDKTIPPPASTPAEQTMTPNAPQSTSGNTSAGKRPMAEEPTTTAPHNKAIRRKLEDTFSSLAEKERSPSGEKTTADETPN